MVYNYRISSMVTANEVLKKDKENSKTCSELVIKELSP